ncbi:MAG: nucleotide exchange factor GrpE [Tissierellia bacterium]|nr:nucleotide exchange factor GrpE [Tissierellia bacterium]
MYEEIRNYEDAYGKIDMTPKLQKKFQENMSSGVFKAIDNLILTKEFFEDSYQPVLDDDIVSNHPDFSTLCEQLIDKLKTDLSEELEIEMMPVNRGDRFNIEHHTPFIEPEPDKELEDGLIKKVINNGFKMGDEILKNCEVIVVRNVK